MVIGDVMLDKYIHGNVERISPEAPVPVVHVKKENYVPGGALNTACNIVTLGGNALVVGIIGNDDAGKTLQNELKQRKINSEGIVISSKKPTIQKVRILGQNQQLVRIDYEKNNVIDEDAENKIIELINHNIQNVDAVVISDYAKGCITENVAKKAIEIANKNSKIVIVDPKPNNKALYKGSFLITPNKKEACEMTKIEAKTEEDILKIGKKLIEELDSNVLVTRGEKGMTLFEKNGEITNIPTQAKEVYDVSGAGDSVIAALALALSSKTSLQEASILANHAGSIAVGKIGTATITLDELSRALEKQSTKVKTLEELKGIVDDLKKKEKSIVWTNGCFDILHVGHVKYLQEAKKLGDILILGLNNDESIKRLKGKNRPIVSQHERAEILSALLSVDYLIFFEQDTPINEIKILVPNIIVKGGDYKEEDIVGHDIMKESGGKVEVIPFIGEFSTTNIINKILETHKE